MMITVGILSSFEARNHIGPVFQENDLGISYSAFFIGRLTKKVKTAGGISYMSYPVITILFYSGLAWA
jgi:hypothetical protein